MAVLLNRIPPVMPCATFPPPWSWVVQPPLRYRHFVSLNTPSNDISQSLSLITFNLASYSFFLCFFFIHLIFAPFSSQGARLLLELTGRSSSRPPPIPSNPPLTSPPSYLSDYRLPVVREFLAQSVPPPHQICTLGLLTRPRAFLVLDDCILPDESRKCATKAANWNSKK